MIEAIKKRRSVREFKDKKVEGEKIREILKAGMYSPSAHAKYPWEILVVEDEEKREALSDATKWSFFAEDAPVCFVILGDEEESDRWIEDTSILSEHIWLESVEQGLGGCWIQIRNGSTKDPSRDPEEYVRELLDIPEKWRVLCILAMGYPAESKEPHSESDFRSEKVHRGAYGSS
ncbi:MAG: nitroreductase family protein [Candidatus Aenigmatarchaeota archaeon]